VGSFTVGEPQRTWLKDDLEKLPDDAPLIVFVSGNDFAGAPNGSNCQTATTGGTAP